MLEDRGKRMSRIDKTQETLLRQGFEGRAGCRGIHLYVHIPFCDGKCDYCGFYSVKYSPVRAEQFLDALAMELKLLWPEGGPDLKTVYIGGGTPSVLSPAELVRLTELLRSHCRIATDVEWTVEGSPNTLNAEKVGLLTGAGVNRISVGVQTFDDAVLAAMKRRHSGAQARRILEELAGTKGLAVGCDFIAGLPGQTAQGWRRDLEGICEAGLTHASVYALSVEEGTPLCAGYKKGGIVLPEEGEVIQRLEYCAGYLGERGLERYEVSNYAVSGHECRHNLGYWCGADFAGVGPGASSRLGLTRGTNRANLDAYLKAVSGGRGVPCDKEEITFEDDATERLMYHFRLKAGVDFEGFCRKQGIDGAFKAGLVERLGCLEEEGLVELEDGRYMPTARGMDFADAIAEVLTA